jgi:hypothetical protein
MKKIFILDLENRVTGVSDFIKYYSTNTNPLDDKLSCLRKINLPEVRDYEEILEDEYHCNDEDLTEIRFNEIKSVYKINSKELSDYILNLKDYEVNILMDMLGLDIDLESYKQDLIKNSRDHKIKNVLNKEIIDFLFLELYIKKKYNERVEDYFNIGKMSVSGWRKTNTVPPKRLIEFYEKEKSINILELFKNLYNL